MREDIIKRRGYDTAIAGSDFSLLLASYPETAAYLAQRLKAHGTSLAELCCGVGVSLTAYAQVFSHVTGVELDPAVVADCKTNLAAAGITNITVIHGDVASAEVLDNLTADIVAYDVPYWHNHYAVGDKHLPNPDLKQLVADIRSKITEQIVIYTPPEVTYEEIVNAVGPDCEYQLGYINGRHDKNFVFLGSLIQQPGQHRLDLVK